MNNGTLGKSIREVSYKYNVSSRTLEFYEYKGIIESVRVGTSRFYMPKDIVRLELILKGKKFGFSLEEIRLLIESDSQKVLPQHR